MSQTLASLEELKELPDYLYVHNDRWDLLIEGMSRSLQLRITHVMELESALIIYVMEGTDKSVSNFYQTNLGKTLNCRLIDYSTSNEIKNDVDMKVRLEKTTKIIRSTENPALVIALTFSIQEKRGDSASNSFLLGRK